MKLALLLGAVIAVAQFFAWAVPEGLKNLYLLYPDGDWNAPYDFWTHWMGGDGFSFPSYLYRLLLPFLAVLPFGASYLTDTKSGYIKQLAARADRGQYLRAKMTACFCSGGIAALFPLIVSFVLCSAVMPLRGPNHISNADIGSDSIFGELYLNATPLYLLCSALLLVVFAGAIAWVSLAVSLCLENRFLVLLSPFALMLFAEESAKALTSELVDTLVPTRFLMFSRYMPSSLGVALLELAVLLLLGVLFYAIARRRDIL